MSVPNDLFYGSLCRSRDSNDGPDERHDGLAIRPVLCVTCTRSHFVMALGCEESGTKSWNPLTVAHALEADVFSQSQIILSVPASLFLPFSIIHL